MRIWGREILQMALQPGMWPSSKPSSNSTKNPTSTVPIPLHLDHLSGSLTATSPLSWLANYIMGVLENLDWVVSYCDIWDLLKNNEKNCKQVMIELLLREGRKGKNSVPRKLQNCKVKDKRELSLRNTNFSFPVFMFNPFISNILFFHTIYLIS